MGKVFKYNNMKYSEVL